MPAAVRDPEFTVGRVHLNNTSKKPTVVGFKFQRIQFKVRKIAENWWRVRCSNA